MFEFKLPDVGEGMHEAEVVRWLVAVGDDVRQDQPVVEIQTDKALMDLPAPVAGRVAELAVQPGSVARVGETLIVFVQEARSQEPGVRSQESGVRNETNNRGPKAEDRRPRTEDRGPKTEDSEEPIINRQSSIVNRRVLAAPAVRKMALELGVDLAQVTGSGPAGRVLPEDVRRFVDGRAKTKDGGPTTTVGANQRVRPHQRTDDQQPMTDDRRLTTDDQHHVSSIKHQPQSAMPERVPLQGLRRRIAERMEQAWRVPHVTSFETVEAARLAALRRELAAEAERRGIRLTYTALAVKIVVQALKQFPYFNASLDMERQEIMLHQQYHIGIATAIPDGLVVPVVRDASRLSALQIAAEIGRLAEGARARTLKQHELSGSTFTITNFGSFGGQQGTPIINPPEVAILGLGRIDEQPVVVDGQVVARPVLPLALSFDHRLIDGAAAAQFLGHIKALLHRPELLMLDLT